MRSAGREVGGFVAEREREFDLARAQRGDGLRRFGLGQADLDTGMGDAELGDRRGAAR